jgi:hypothetical protein
VPRFVGLLHLARQSARAGNYVVPVRGDIRDYQLSTPWKRGFQRIRGAEDRFTSSTPPDPNPKVAPSAARVTGEVMVKLRDQIRFG